MGKLFETKKLSSAKTKLNVLFLAYQSLTNFSCVKVGPSEVGRQLRIRQ